MAHRAAPRRASRAQRVRASRAPADTPPPQPAVYDSPYAYTVTDPGEFPFTFKNIMAVTIDQDAAMKFSMWQGLLARMRLCKHCDREMTLHVYHAGTDEEDRRWRCRRSGHPDTELSVRSGSFFSRGRLQLSTTLRLMLFWASGLPVGRAQKFLDISNKTAIDWYGFCRDICTKEMLLCPMEKKSKYGRGRQHEDHWLFGGVDRNTGRWFGILTYSDRKKKTLSPLIGKHIKAGTTIISDQFASYTHKWVNHDKYFVDPVSGAHTNRIECCWEIRIKHYIKAMRGIPKDWLPPYLDVFCGSRGTVPSC
ncbi:hypothetical protein PHMEG_00027745 [Phytophthora megakarya]|uniref:ISXO2-like transposase domain-containing protein n=1 Tax=Phytophthora megakarya TaxID=4795 RepID=A0A225V7M2_9STRA|nr:hypothetical protein PHMEG_00027745 [Phytophthora megakarya]